MEKVRLRRERLKIHNEIKKGGQKERGMHNYYCDIFNERRSLFEDETMRDVITLEVHTNHVSPD
jgi:hypothetical protein